MRYHMIGAPLYTKIFDSNIAVLAVLRLLPFHSSTHLTIRLTSDIQPQPATTATAVNCVVTCWALTLHPPDQRNRQQMTDEIASSLLIVH